MYRKGFNWVYTIKQKSECVSSVFAILLLHWYVSEVVCCVNINQFLYFLQAIPHYDGTLYYLVDVMNCQINRNSVI